MKTLVTHFAIWEGTLASSDAHKPPKKSQVISKVLNDHKKVLTFSICLSTIHALQRSVQYLMHVLKAWVGWNNIMKGKLVVFALSNLMRTIEMLPIKSVLIVDEEKPSQW